MRQLQFCLLLTFITEEATDTRGEGGVSLDITGEAWEARTLSVMVVVGRVGRGRQKLSPLRKVKFNCNSVERHTHLHLGEGSLLSSI